MWKPPIRGADWWFMVYLVIFGDLVAKKRNFVTNRANLVLPYI